jgi:glycine/D-amino acid oxidase-like deaminating enzyme
MGARSPPGGSSWLPGRGRCASRPGISPAAPASASRRWWPCPGPDDPVLYFFDADAFLLPVVERRHWLFSYTCQVWDYAPEGSHRITEEDRENGLAILTRYCPELAARCTGGRVFCDSYGPEWVPVVTAAAAAPQVVLATAGSGAGYRLGPAIARQALDKVISGASGARP